MKIKKLLTKSMGLFNVLALALVAQTANSACIWITYQPEFPTEARKLKK